MLSNNEGTVALCAIETFLRQRATYAMASGNWRDDKQARIPAGLTVGSGSR